MTAASIWTDGFDEEEEELDENGEQRRFDTRPQKRGRGASPSGPLLARRPSLSPQACGSDIEYEYAMLMPDHHHDSDVTHGRSTSSTSPSRRSGTETFALDCDDDLVAAVPTGFEQDCRAPQFPEPLASFTHEDMRLQEVLVNFYYRHRSENLSKLNVLIERYRGRSVTHLWVRLARKYGLTTHDVIELLAKTLFVSSPFEYSEEGLAALRERQAGELSASFDGIPWTDEDRVGLMRQSLELCHRQGSQDMLRMLCFRGMDANSELRSQVWRILLGCLPAARSSDWDSIQGEMRALYATYKAEVFEVSAGESAPEGLHLRTVALNDPEESMQLFQQILKDVERTKQELELFKRPSSKAAMLALLFVYAHVNPDVGYVQGMNEIAAVIFYVTSADPETEEVDAFWCFTYLMSHIKAGFLTLDTSDDLKPPYVQKVEDLLRSYDPELARHLQQSACPTSIFSFRWCTLFFAQDIPLAHVVRFWDGFIADPGHFDFVSHVSLAALLAQREELLRTSDAGEVAVLLRNATRTVDFDTWLRQSWAICALERRAQTPAFPTTTAEKVVRNLSGWAQLAASRAQKLGVGVAWNVQHGLAPVFKQKVGHASESAAEAAQSGVSAVKAWFQQDTPFQPETVNSLLQTLQNPGFPGLSRMRPNRGDSRDAVPHS